VRTIIIALSFLMSGCAIDLCLFNCYHPTRDKCFENGRQMECPKVPQ